MCDGSEQIGSSTIAYCINRANENKHGAYRQHIEVQGKVIGLGIILKYSKLPSGRNP